MSLLKKTGAIIMMIGAVLSLYNLYKDLTIYNNYAFYILLVGLLISATSLFMEKRNSKM